MEQRAAVLSASLKSISKPPLSAAAAAAAEGRDRQTDGGCAAAAAAARRRESRTESKFVRYDSGRLFPWPPRP